MSRLTTSSGFSIGRLLGLLRWPLAVSLLAWLFVANRDQFARLREEPPRLEFLGPALLLCGSSIILTFYRWYLLVLALEFPFSFRDALRLGFCGYLFNYVAPGAVGGDVIKAVLMAREQTGRRAIAVATILMDRVLGLLALFMVGAGASLLASPEIQHRELILTALWGVTITGVLGLLVLLHPIAVRSRPVRWAMSLPAIGPPINQIVAALALYQARRRTVLLAVLISVAGHLGIISSFYFCARAVAEREEVPTYAAHMQLIPLAEVAGVIVPTPGGLGALEGAVQEAYRLSGAAPGIGLLAAGAYRVTTILIAAVGSLFYFSAKRQLDRLMSENSRA